jgi:hypothetical protein
MNAALLTADSHRSLFPFQGKEFFWSLFPGCRAKRALPRAILSRAFSAKTHPLTQVVLKSSLNLLSDFIDVREQVCDLALGVALEGDHVGNVGSGKFRGRDGKQFDLVAVARKLNEEVGAFFVNRQDKATSNRRG